MERGWGEMAHGRRKARGIRAGGEQGANLVEYALLIGLILLVSLLAVQYFGSGVSNNLSQSASSVAGA
jgi:Flp pilus assembly pilin Flp